MKNIDLGLPSSGGVGFCDGKNRVLSFLNSKGEIKLSSSRTKKSFKNFLKFPFLRGIVIFFYGFWQFCYFLLENSHFNEVQKEEFPFEKKISKKLSITANTIFWSIFSFLTLFFGIFVFGIVPDLVARALPPNCTQIERNALSGSLKLVLFYVIVLMLKIIPAMRAYYRFNGAICAQQNLQSSHKSNNPSSPNYFRSTNFLCFVIFSFALHFFVVSLIGLQINFFLGILFNIAVFLLITSISYEFLKIFETRRFLITRIVAIILCFPVTNKPSRTEMEVCFGAYEELKQMTKDQTRQTLSAGDEIALSTVLCEVKNSLSRSDITDPSEAEWLIATVLEKNRTQMKLTPTITQEQLASIRAAVSERKKHVPLSKIFGWTEFYGNRFIVDKNVLSPRCETELLCEQAIKIINKKDYKKILDLCTGSGAIAITLAKNTNAKIDGVDISKSALKVASKNAQNLGAKVALYESNMFSGLKKNIKFDMIVSNPPYISTKEISLLDEEVKNHDPHIALDGGDDGLDFYRIIAKNAPEFLKKEGYLLLEIGDRQFVDVKKILSENFKNIKVIKDLNNIDRIVVAITKGAKDAGKNTKNKTKI